MPIVFHMPSWGPWYPFCRQNYFSYVAVIFLSDFTLYFLSTSKHPHFPSKSRQKYLSTVTQIPLSPKEVSRSPGFLPLIHVGQGPLLKRSSSICMCRGRRREWGRFWTSSQIEIYCYGGALKGTWQNWASGMLPPKLGHILGCLAFSEYFFANNKTLPRPNHFLKIQWEIFF